MIAVCALLFSGKIGQRNVYCRSFVCSFITVHRGNEELAVDNYYLAVCCSVAKLSISDSARIPL
jgi:hypothetical protein